MNNIRLFFFTILFVPLILKGQQNNDSIPSNASLEACIQYALKNQDILKQAYLDEEINLRDVRSGLSGWLPQIRTEYNYQHYFLLPYIFFRNAEGQINPTRNGLTNQSNVLFQADQVLYNSEVLLASRAAKYSKLQARQNVESARIDVIVNVSKAYYDILLTREQLNVLEEDITRLERLARDSYSQYEAGTLDKIDYKRTTINLNNSNAQKKSINESLKFKYAYLKQLMGIPTDKELMVEFDTTGIESQLLMDTVQTVNHENRVEYQLLRTQSEIQNLNTSYYQWKILPSVSGFVNYNMVFQNNEISSLYNNDYPNSAAGLRISLPIFQGGNRIHNLQKAKLLSKRTRVALDYAEKQINTEYQQALANYKSSLNDYQTQNINLEIAREVYNTVKLQYDEGIKPYLDVITSETDLRTSQLNYLNALYNVLSSKLDLQRALGIVTTNQ
jgi:outer membrane protein